MENNRIGTTVIDALTLCYIAEGQLLNTLREVSHRIDIEAFTLHRILARAFHQYFDVVLRGRKVASIYFDRRETEETELYLWLRFENYVLYDDVLLVDVLSLKKLLKLTFNNISHLDLARDFRYNVSERIRVLMRNPNLKTMINGKQIRNRDEALKGVTRTCRMSLSRDKTKSLTIKQAKAIKNKYDGITLDSYDKMDEIANKSEKHYILDYYDNPKRLHRLELRLKNQDIRRLAETTGVAITAEIIFDKECLDRLYLQALQSILRFTDGRKKLDWQQLFNCNLRYR